VKSAKAPELSVVVKKGRQLESFGGLRAVGNSSPSAAPHLIEIHYEPTEGKNLLHVVLVGKGITYDTGGLSLKRPFDLMIPMKSDMAGAAAILAATLAMAKLQPRIRVTALMMCAENMVSATAQRPSDVITQYGGTTVEVINTDAEGRLVLADGLAYADLELKPDYLLDIATLTGSATLGLGKQFAAMYSRNLTLTTTLHEIGERTGDRVWMMPLIDDYLPALVSPVADFNHDASAQNFGAGSVTAALFLEQFVGQRRWVHLDIAGPARSEVDSGEVIKGGTGFGTRLLIEWLVSLS
jgi:leucyl aminopeptidase